MTVQVDGADVAAMIEVAAWAGSIVSMLIVGLLVYLMVRPPRRRAEAPPDEEAIDARELVRLMERMERRMEVLERAVRAEPSEDTRILEAGEQRPQTRRTK